MTKDVDGDGRRRRQRNKRLGELGKPIRPQVIRPRGFAVPDNPEVIRRENALMVELHEKAVAVARREKLKLLLRHYSLAEGDYEGLALALAIEHEPGFQVDCQIAEATLDFRGPVKVDDGKLVDNDTRIGRPEDWTVERLGDLLEAVELEKKKLNGSWKIRGKSGLAKDLDALRRLAKRKDWQARKPSRSSRGEYDARVRTLQVRLSEAKNLKRRADEEIAVLQEIANQIGKNSGND